MKTAPPLLLLCLAASTAAGTSHAVPPLDPQFEGVDVDNRLGQKVMVDVPFTSSSAPTTSLGAFLDGKGGRPVLLTLNYYRCESLCNVQLNTLLERLVALGWAPGPERFRIVTVSFDPSDTLEIARGKQETYRTELARMLAEKAGETLTNAQLAERANAIDWTFLVGDDRSVRTFTSQLGYRFNFDERTRQYAHSPVMYLLTSEGIIARYLWGLELPERDLEFALVDASEGNLGSFGTKLLMSCFVFEDGQYAFAWGIMRIGGGIVVLVLGIWLFRWWRREQRRSAAAVLPGSGGAGSATANGQGS